MKSSKQGFASAGLIDSFESLKKSRESLLASWLSVFLPTVKDANKDAHKQLCVRSCLCTGSLGRSLSVACLDSLCRVSAQLSSQKM